MAIVDSFAAHRFRGGIVRRFEIETKFELTLVVSEGGQRSPYVDSFVETLKEISKNHKSDDFLSGKRP